MSILTAVIDKHGSTRYSPASVALCIVYPIHNSWPAGPFGKARVREVDGEMPNLPNENGQRNYPKCPEGQKSPKSRGFYGVEFGQGETVLIHPNSLPAAQRSAGQPVMSFATGCQRARGTYRSGGMSMGAFMSGIRRCRRFRRLMRTSRSAADRSPSRRRSRASESSRMRPCRRQPLSLSA